MRRRNAACEYRPLALLDVCVCVCVCVVCRSSFTMSALAFLPSFFDVMFTRQHDARREVQ